MLPRGTPSASVTAALSAPDASRAERTSRNDAEGSTAGAPELADAGTAAVPAVINARRSAQTNSAMNASFGGAQRGCGWLAHKETATIRSLATKRPSLHLSHDVTFA